MINRILERLENLEYQRCPEYSCWQHSSKGCGLCDIREVKIGEVKQIIQEVAEEYKGGWIPCSERLPEEDGYYLVTMKLWVGSYVTTHAFRGGEWHLASDDCPVLAWQPLPAPYEEV